MMKKILVVFSVLVLLALLISTVQASTWSSEALAKPTKDTAESQGAQKQTERAEDAAEKTAEAGEDAQEDEEEEGEDSAKNEDKKASQQAKRDTRKTEIAAKKTERAGGAEEEGEEVEGEENPGQSKKGKKEHYKGTLEAVSGGSLTIMLKDGTSVSVALTEDTRIKIPGESGAGADMLEAGMTVGVQAVRDADSDTLSALSVQAIPGKPEKVHRVGTVTEYSGGSISIEARAGESSTFEVDAEVKILPEERAGELGVGAYVTIIAPRSTGGDPVATGIVIHPGVPGEGNEVEQEPDQEAD